MGLLDYKDPGIVMLTSFTPDADEFWGFRKRQKKFAMSKHNSHSISKHICFATGTSRDSVWRDKNSRFTFGSKNISIDGAINGFDAATVLIYLFILSFNLLFPAIQFVFFMLCSISVPICVRIWVYVCVHICVYICVPICVSTWIPNCDPNRRFPFVFPSAFSFAFSFMFRFVFPFEFPIDFPFVFFICAPILFPFTSSSQTAMRNSRVWWWDSTAPFDNMG